MSRLRNDNLDPRMMESPIDRADYLGGIKFHRKKAAEVLRNQLTEWELFRGTKSGQVVMNVAGPKISHYQERVCMGVRELRQHFNNLGLHNVSVEELEAYRNQCIGKLAVWRTIAYRIDELERQLAELDEMEKEEKKATEKKTRLPDTVESYMEER